jgi:hypothetical protein
MTDVDLPYTITVGQQRSASRVQANAERLRDALNLDVDSAAAEAAGLSTATAVRRGKSIVATEQSTTSTSYTTLTTPDQVESVVLPADGLLVVRFMGMMKESVSAAASIALFIGSNQLKSVVTTGGAPAVQEDALGGTADRYSLVTTNAHGIYVAQHSGSAYSGHVTTGQSVANGVTDTGRCEIFANAGTYTVSVRYKVSSGSVTAKERKLWVETKAF